MQWLRRALGAEMPPEHQALMADVSKQLDVTEERLRQLRTAQEARGLAIEADAIAREHGVETARWEQP
jgi:hypothetical protein